MSDTDNKRACVDLGALKHNYRVLCDMLRKKSPALCPIAVVKADAYGHGAPECVRALLAAGCHAFAVSCIEEAIAVRATCREQKKRADVLILGYTKPTQARAIAENDLIQSLLSPAYAELLAAEAGRAGVSVRAHVAVDTGMNRLGFDAHNDEEIASSAEAIVRLFEQRELTIEGMYTHFATADENTEKARKIMRRQLKRYQILRTCIEKRGVSIPFHHVCNSAAAVSEAGDAMDGVRLGILLYGGASYLHGSMPLRPVMRLEADVVHVHTLRAGESISYGGTYTASEDRTVATLPIGYADGFVRDYSGASVRLCTRTGRFDVPIIGRICMDQCMIDVTGTDCSVGDTAILLGDDVEQLKALAARAKTIEYEPLCLISSRVKRTYENTEL